MDMTTLRAAMADIIAQSYHFETTLRKTTDPDFGDEIYDFHYQDTFASLSELEAADPEDYLKTLQHFGPEAIHHLTRNLAGSNDYLKVPNFVAACLRLGQPDMDAQSAQTRADPKNAFNPAAWFDPSNVNNDILRPWLRAVEAWLNNPDLPAHELPDSKDYFVLGILIGQAMYGMHGPHMTRRAIALIEEGIRLADSNPNPDPAMRLRIATFLGGGGRLLPGCAGRDDSNPLPTLAQMIGNAATLAADLYVSPIRGREDCLQYANKQEPDPRYAQYQTALAAQTNSSSQDEPFYQANTKIALLREIYGNSFADDIMNGMDRGFLDIANKLHSLASVIVQKAQTNPLFVFPVREAMALQRDLVEKRTAEAQNPTPEINLETPVVLNGPSPQTPG